jgi:hypothetical protein
MDWATFWAIFEQTNLVTLPPSAHSLPIFREADSPTAGRFCIETFFSSFIFGFFVLFWTWSIMPIYQAAQKRLCGNWWHQKGDRYLICQVSFKAVIHCEKRGAPSRLFFQQPFFSEIVFFSLICGLNIEI